MQSSGEASQFGVALPVVIQTRPCRGGGLRPAAPVVGGRDRAADDGMVGLLMDRRPSLLYHTPRVRELANQVGSRSHASILVAELTLDS